MLTLNQYRLIATKIVRKHFRRFKNHEELVGEITSAIMMADWQGHPEFRRPKAIWAGIKYLSGINKDSSFIDVAAPPNYEVNDFSSEVLYLLDNSGLTLKQIELLRLRFLEGKTCQQISQICGTTNGNVSKRIQYALEVIRNGVWSE